MGLSDLLHSLEPAEQVSSSLKQGFGGLGVKQLSTRKIDSVTPEAPKGFRV